MSNGLNDHEMPTPDHDPRSAAIVEDSADAYDIFPVSFAQQRLWFLHQLDPASPQYNVPTALRLQGPLDVDALEASIQSIVARHEPLRTTFSVVDGEPMQMIWPEAELHLARVDLRVGVEPDAREDEARRLAVIEARRPFNLERGPLLRTTLLQQAEQEYILLLTLHHIVADGWSVGVFVRELAAYYAAHITDQAAVLPDLPIQYADFAVWQRQQLAEDAPGALLDVQLDYWRTQLRPLQGDALPVLELPSDQPHTPVRSGLGARHHFVVDQTTAAALTDLSRREQVTLFMTLLAAFNVLLYRYTGQTDLLVGTPIANRNQDELEGLIGFFSNTLVLRSDLADEPSFRELLQRVRATTVAAYDHQDVPFEKLVEVLQPSRDLDHNPLFQVMFVLQNAPIPPLQLAHLTLSTVDIDPATAKFDLLLSFSESERGLDGMFEYSVDRFSAASIARMAEHFQSLLAAIVAQPTERIAALSLLTAAEHRRTLVEWNATTTDAVPANVIELFEAQAARTPDAVAAIVGAEQVSYAELNRRANQLAHRLRGLGVGPETRVGICAERSIALLVGVLGVLKAGGAYVPLDPQYPAERLQFMLRHSRVPLILTQQSLLATLPDSAAQVICLDRDWPAIAQEATHNPPIEIAPDNLAYVIYTSGSTGQPKGVAMPHQPLANLIDWHLRDAALSRPARTLHFAPISFDVSFQELLSCWSSGGTLLVVADELRRDPAALLRYLDEAAVERLFVPFVALQQLAEAATSAASLPRHLREIITAGEQLHMTDALSRWLARTPDCTLHNHYGPTESHVVTSYTLRGDPADWPARPPIGRPVANSEMYVLDAQMQPVLIGVAGELYIGGLQLARGYLDQPALTAERFVPHPFASTPGARLYKTGDLARYLGDGNIEFLGRADEQLKVRGFRIEPGEIESALRQHPAVREAVVVGQQHSGQTRLVAYVVEEPRTKNQEPGDGGGEPRTKNQEPEEGNEGTKEQRNTGAGEDRSKNQEPADTADGSWFSVLGSSELRAFLAARLPDYMIPSAFVVLDALPLTPSGKVDRRALPEPGAVDTQASEVVAPQSPLEERLAAIWSEVLGIAPISIHANFFTIGGHSLLATQINSRIRTTFNVELPLRTLFENSTIATLAAQIALRTQQADQHQIPIQPRSGDDQFPLSFAQQRLWFLHQLDPDSAAYNIPAALRLRGRLDPAALERSLDALVARHETLRTQFSHQVDDAGQPTQIVGRPYSVALPIIDLQDEPDSRREDRVRELALAEARRPFDLQRDPLLRTTLLRLRPDEHVLLLTVHHIIADGWSINILIDELVAGYRTTTQPAPLPVQYADWAIWQREALQRDPTMQQQIAYWKRQLAGAPTVLELPIALPRQAGQVIESAVHTLHLAPDLSAALIALSRQHDVTLFMTLLAAFDVLLYRYTGQTDLLVGVPTAGRTRPEIERLIGFFINTLVLRGDLSGNPSFAELLQRVRVAAMDAYAHQDLPFEHVVKEVQPDRALHQQPLVQAVFVFQSTPITVPSLPELELSALATGEETAKFDLTLLAESTERGIQTVFKYNRAIFPAASIEGMAEHFQCLLTAIAARPTERIAALTLLTAAERHRMLVEWNATAAPYPAGQCYHELFEAQAARTPDAIAVIFGVEQLSYAALNRRANQLAHHLRELGVGPETRVGICAERSIDLVVALLGVLKAGGAYVPLDPNYPAERLQFMLEDAQVGVLLTQQRLLSGLPSVQAAVVQLDADWPAIERQPRTNPRSGATISNLAYVIYTSGSTGRPKGVMVTHEGVGNLAASQINDFKLGPGSRVLQFVSFSFDGAVSEFVMALLSGATLCLALPGSSLPGPALIEQLRDQAITTMKLPPSALTVLPAAELPALRTVISAGEPLSQTLVQRWKNSAPAGCERRFFNAYGPSENTVCATIGECHNDEPRPHVGRPLPNKEIYILDPWMQPVPVGVPGELHIGGIGLARGYLDRPALTAERFVPHPFATSMGARLYKTGDLARFLPDGNIEFVGRVDHQVKVRGFRIELGEIEAVLRQHPAVREAVAIVREDQPGERRVVAYVVGEEPRTKNQEPEGGNNGTTEQGNKSGEFGAGADGAGMSLPSTSELRTFLATRLPDYMVPSAFVPLDALPLTPNGKIDREALPAPSTIRPELDSTFVAAQGWIEQTIARIWAEVLRLEQVGVHDNFFDLGGDSILSIQITARANQAGLRLTPKQIFQHQTIAELAQAVGTQQTIQAEQALVTGPLPLTPIQQRFFEQEQPQPHHWNQSLLLEAGERLDPDLVATAVQQLLAHHDALRLRFVRTATGWQQHNAGLDDSPPLVTIDLGALPSDQQITALETAAAEWQTRLNLADGPLLRAVLFDLGPQQPSRLLLAVHHLVVDGVSWRTVLEDLQTAYQQLKQATQTAASRQVIHLPPKTTAYKHWAERLVEYADSEALHTEWPYWRDLLRAPVTRLPVDDPSGRGFNSEGAAHSIAVALEADETRALLQDVPQVYHTQINDVLLTALALAFKRRLGLGPLLIDLEGQGREPLFDDLDVSRTVGWFTTVFPVLLSLPDDQEPGAALREVKEQLRQTPQRGIGYGLLRYLSQQPAIRDALRAQPQAEIGFNYLGQFDQLFDQTALFRPARESGGAARAAQARRAHLIDINIGVFEGCLQASWTYSPALHQQATVDGLAQSFLAALRELIAHCLDTDSGGYTPTDFSAFNWSQADLDDITSSIGRLMGES